MHVHTQNEGSFVKNTVLATVERPLVDRLKFVVNLSQHIRTQQVSVHFTVRIIYQKRSQTTFLYGLWVWPETSPYGF
jgi:hypothetical protein